MKTNTRTIIVRSALTVLVTIVALAACNNPFQVGLGAEVNLGVPDVVLNSHPSGSYLRGSVELGGQYTDGFAVTGPIRSVTLSFDGGATAVEAKLTPASDQGQTSSWTYAAETSAFADGEIEVIVTANYQNAGSDSVEKRILLFFDNTAPIVMVTLPQDYESNAYNGTLSVKGEAADQFGIDSVEYRLLDGSDGVLADWREADGTSSWSALFNSLTHIPAGTGVINVELRATDRAGNVSSTVVHYDDVLTRNGSQAITAEALVKILRGEAVAGATISGADLDAIAVDELALNFNQDLDAPTFIVSNPDSLEGAAVPSDNVVSGSPRFTGSVEDDFEGVNPTSIQFRITEYVGGAGVAPYDVWTNVTSTSGSGLLVRWTADISGLTDGTYNVQLRANDNGTASGVSGLVPFQVDTGAPTITNVLPNQGTYVNGEFTISGDANDGSGIQSVDVIIDEGAPIGATVTGTPPNESWTVDIDPLALGLLDGNLSIQIEASDGGPATTYNLQLILDDTKPTATFTNPPPSSTVNGQVIVRGTASDNTRVEQVELKVGNEGTGIGDGFEVLLDQTYNWDSTIDVTAFANSTDADEVGVGTDVWEFDVTARVTDAAGNVESYVHTFFIDNNLDKPRVSILAPADGQAISGSVFVTGTAIDDDAVQEVFMQLDVDGDGLFTSTAVTRGPSSELVFDETAIISLNGTTAWATELNADGSLYYAGSYIGPGPDDYDGWVTMKIWARDINSLDGNPVEQIVQFDDTKARADNLNYASGDFVNGTFVLQGQVVDDNEVTSVDVSTDGGQTWTSLSIPSGPGYADAVTTTPDWTATLSDTAANEAPEAFDLDLSVDTTATGLDIASGILYLRIRVDDGTDNFVNQTTAFVNLSVDNTYPTRDAAITSDIGNISGTFTINGTARDSGTIAGIDSIHVYFMRGTDVFRIDPIAAQDTTIAQTTQDFSDAGGAVASLPYAPANVPPVYYRSEIDQFIADSDPDPFDELISLSGSVYSWYTDFNSAKISDGPVNINYVIFDSAGNGTRYVESGFIRNNPPEFDNIVIGSDLNGNGNTTDTDLNGDGGATTNDTERITFSSPSSPLSSGFTARNNVLYVDLNAVAGGNTPLTFSVQKDGVGPNLVDPGTGLASIDTSSAVDFPDGLTSFTASITDAVGIVETLTFSVEIDNTDDQDPTVTIDALTQSDVKETAGVPDGHLEENGTSTYNGGDADVSGTVILKGTVSDDQLLDAITIQIPDYDAGSGVAGGTHVIAAWDGTQMVSEEPEFTVLSETLAQDAGHEVSWSYEWNSALVGTVAANNVTISMNATDASANSPTATTRTVDVVPYITDVETQLTEAFPSAPSALGRTATGKYPVRRGETISIYGFNFSAATATVSVGATVTAAPVAIVGPPTGISVPVPAGATSGELVVAVSGVYSLNNANSNALAQNMEPNGVNNPLLTDDRVLNVWDFTTIAGTASARYPIMRISPSNEEVGFSYAAGETQFAMIGSDGISRIYETNYTRYNYTTFGFDTSGNVYGAALNSDRINNSYGGSSRLGFFYRQQGSRATGGADGYQSGTYKRHLEHNWNGTVYDSLRSQYPDMHVQGAGTGGDPATIGLTYYDASENLVKFRYGTVDGGADGDVAGAISQNYVNGSTGTDGSVDGYQTIAGTGTSGPYSAITMTQEGVAVVAWYDSTNRFLRYSYNTNPGGASEAQWATNTIVIDNFFAGQYVDVAADPDGGIHIAYYSSSSGDLKYAYLASYDAGTAETVTVDSFLSVGQNLTVQTRLIGATHVPYISYYVAAYDGTLSSLKLAQRLPAAGALGDGMSSDQYTGRWEIQSLPVPSIPKNYTVSIGFVGSTPVVGYASDAGLQYGQLY